MRVSSKWGRASACAVLLLLSACGTSAGDAGPAETTSSTAPEDAAAEEDGASPDEEASATPVSNEVAIDQPGELDKSLLSSDVLIYSQDTLDADTIESIEKVKGITTVEKISMGQFYAGQQEVTYAAVDPASFRRFTPPGTAQTQAVWNRVAAGEIAVEPAMGRKLQEKGGFLRVGNESSAEKIHIGAYATILDPTKAKRIDAVVNYKWAQKLGMRKNNALLVSMDDTSPQSVRKQLQKYAGSKASVQILGPDLDLKATQTAFLTGGSVSKAVGSFSYRGNPDGTVTPDPRWVAANITTDTMPIIGQVTGHRVMLPQLKAVMSEIAARGLGDKIKTYDGCYVPRFIASDPSKGLSFHTFGTAIDLNAATNYRGIPGDIDRTVVEIFKKWGFAWGGDWNYTDPMHFELAKIVKAR